MLEAAIAARHVTLKIDKYRWGRWTLQHQEAREGKRVDIKRNMIQNANDSLTVAVCESIESVQEYRFILR